ncbi:MAG: protein kinase [Bacteroidetes bacterium]|nr:protein kinase [Bacteroidota bacterium]
MKLNQYEWDPENDVIGNGAFAEVFRAKDNNGHFVALKIYREAIAKGSTGGSFQGKYTLEQEYKKGELLAHTNVIRYLNFDYIVHTDSMQRQVSYPVLVMEYADAGNLAGWLRSTMPPTEAESVQIILQILNGLAYLHDQGIIHRDLKPGNILFKKDRKGNNVVKISDFGISRDVLEDNTNRPSTTAGVGTIDYMAPEQLLKKTYGLNGAISNRTDLWAVGVMFYRMLTGKMPFGEENKDYESIHDEIITKEPDYSRVPGRYQPMIKACLQKHASARPEDAEAVLKMFDTEYKEQRKIVPSIQEDRERTQINPVDLDPFKNKKKDIPVIPPPVPVKNDWGTKVILTIAAVIVVIIVINVLPKVFKNNPDTTSNTSSASTIDTTNKHHDSLVKKAADTTTVKPYTQTSNPSDKVYVQDKPIVLNFKDKSYNVTYTGWLKNGLPTGYGTKIFTSGDLAGDKYVGESTDGIADGKGKRYFHSGDYYEGDFRNGVIDGSGIYIQANGDKYLGQFVNGYETGEGTMYYNRDDQYKGDRYVGNWYNGTYSGKGTYYWHDGKTYEGDWENGKQSGQGTMTFSDGSKYVGAWSNGNRNGYGDVYDKDGKVYSSGQWENGQLKN